MLTEIHARAHFNCIGVVFAVMATLMVLPVELAAQSPSVTATPATVAPGGTLTITVANGPGNPNDWVTLSSTSAPDSTYVAWKYLNGTTVPPPAGLSNATLQLAAPMTPGTYNVRLFANDSWVKLATSSAVTVVNGAPVPMVAAAPAAVAPGGTFTVTVANGPGNPNDWVTLSSTSAPDSTYVAWKYLNGTTVPPPAGLPNATLQLAAPMTPGTYNVRLFANGSWARLATSSAVTVVNSAPGPTVAAPAAVAPGGVITVTVANGPGNPNDWVTLSSTSAPDSTYVAWKYLNGTTVPPPAGLPNATLQLVAPMTPGTYNVRLFANGGWVKLATSTPIAVSDTTAPLLTNITISSIAAAGATISWTTNEGSDSQVDYGPTTAYGSVSPLNGSLVTAHSVILGALAANTTYHFRVRSRDSAGNLAVSGDFTFTTLVLDLTAPVVSITAPANNATVSGTVTFSANATDNVGVTGVEFKRDGVNVAPEDTSAPYTVSWNTTTATQGVHTLTAVAWDAAGNSATATRTVTVSNSFATVQLAWDANTEADLAGYRVKVGTTSGVYTLSNISVGNVTSYTVTGLPPGDVYYFAVTAVNLSGAESVASNEVSASR